MEQITDEALANLEEIHSRKDLRKFYLRTVVKHEVMANLKRQPVSTKFLISDF